MRISEKSIFANEMEKINNKIKHKLRLKISSETSLSFTLFEYCYQQLQFNGKSNWIGLYVRAVHTEQ